MSSIEADATGIGIQASCISVQYRSNPERCSMAQKVQFCREGYFLLPNRE
jgi:hypothetical protein